MPAQFKVGSFVWDTGSSNKAITGVGFQPEYVMVFGSLMPDFGTVYGGCLISVGMRQDSGTGGFLGHSRIFSSNRSTFGAEPTVVAGGRRNSEIISEIPANTNGTVTARNLMSIISLDADGFTMDPTLASDAYQYFYLAIGGGIDVTFLLPNWPTTTGAQVLTGAGFEPTLALVFATLTDESWSIGWYDGTRQGCTVIQTRNGVTGASVAKSYQVTNKVVAIIDDAGAVVGEAEATGFTADGIDLNWTTAFGGTQEAVSVILFGGLTAHVGSLTQPATAIPQVISGLDVDPSVVLFASACAAANASIQANMRQALGLSDGTQNFGTWMGDQDAVTSFANRRNTKTMRDDAAIVMGTPTGTGSATINARAAVTALSALGGFTLDWDAADATLREVLFLALGPAPPDPPPAPPVPDNFCTTKEEPVIFVSVAPTGQDRQWYGVTALPDHIDYYGGWKEDRLLGLSEIRRALAGPQLDYEIGTFNIDLADEDYAIRGMLEDSPGSFYSRWEIDAYMITPSGRLAEATPMRLATGQVDSDPSFDDQEQAMSVRFSCRDRVGVGMGWTSTGQAKLPRRVLSQTTLPGVASTMEGKGAWIPWGLLSTNIIVPSGFSAPLPTGIAARGSYAEGAYWITGFAPWDQTIAPVTGVAATGVVGGDCPERDYAVEVFPVSSDGRVGDPTPYVTGDETVTITSPNQIVQVDWVASPDAAKYYVALYADYFGWRVQQILETTGTSVQFNHAFDTPDAGTGFATGAVGSETPFFYYSARSIVDGTIASAWHEVEDPALYPEQFGRSLTLPNGKIRPLRIYWTTASGADSYQVKKRAAGPFTPQLFPMLVSSLEDGLVYWDEDFIDTDAITGDPLPNRAGGRLKVEFTREVTLPDGDNWMELFIAGVPIQGVDDWYYDPGGDSSNVEINEDDGTVFLFPKDGSAWDTILSERYRDVVGTDGITRRYSLGYARGEKGRLIASGMSIVTVNLRGVEDVGDCSGELITDLHLQTEHELNYFVVASGEGYTTGLWGPAPTQGYDNLPIVNSASFTLVKEMRDAEVAGGMVAAGVTGALGERVDVSTWLKRRMVSGDWRLGPNRDWQISAAAINQNLSPLFIDEILTDEYDIHTRTFKPQPRLGELQNVFAYRYKRSLIDSEWLADNLVERNDTSIENWNLTKQGEDLDFHYVEDPGPVSLALSRHVSRRANAPMYVGLEGSMCLLSSGYDIGNYFKIKHWRGVAVGGWLDRVMWIVSSTFNPITKRVRLECLDVTTLLGTGPTYAVLEELMDIDLGGSWYHSPDVGPSPDVVDAYEYRDRRIPWASLPTGTTATARVYGRVSASGISMTLRVYDPDNLVVIATDPTPFTNVADFELHTFPVPASTANLQYRLQATVTSGESESVWFNGIIRTDLP